MSTLIITFGAAPDPKVMDLIASGEVHHFPGTTIPWSQVMLLLER